MKTLTREQRNAVYKRAIEIKDEVVFGVNDKRIGYCNGEDKLISQGLCILLKYAHLDIDKSMGEYMYWEVENIFHEFKDFYKSENYIFDDDYRLNVLNKAIEQTS